MYTLQSFSGFIETDILLPRLPGLAREGHRLINFLAGNGAEMATGILHKNPKSSLITAKVIK